MNKRQATFPNNSTRRASLQCGPGRVVSLPYINGFSLIELMISSVLSLLLLAVVVKLYQHNQSAYRQQQTMAELQENARMAIHMLQTGLQSAGYIGCGRIDNIRMDSDDQEKVAADMTIIGYENGRTTARKPIADYYVRRFAPGTDAIVVRHMNTQTADLASAIKTGDSVLNLSKEKGLATDDRIIIADCVHLQTAQITEQYNQQLTIKPVIRYPFVASAQVGRWMESVFYIGDTGRVNSRGTPILSLYWLDTTRAHVPSEVVEGVEKMSILYGVLSSRGLVYQPASQVMRWEQVRTVQVTLLLNSVEPVENRIFRREWNTQITLRNRV